MFKNDSERQKRTKFVSYMTGFICLFILHIFLFTECKLLKDHNKNGVKSSLHLLQNSKPTFNSSTASI